MSSSSVSDLSNDSWVQWQQLQASKNDRFLSQEQDSYGPAPLSTSKSDHENSSRTSSLKAATVSRRKSIREMVQSFHSSGSSSETQKSTHGRKSSLAAHQRRKSLVSAFDSILGRKHAQHAANELAVPVASIRSSSIQSSGGESTSPTHSLRSKKSAESISSSSSSNNTGLRRHVSSGASLVTPSASQSHGYYKPALRNHKAPSSPSLDKIGPLSSDLMATVSAAQNWLDQQPAGPMNKENRRRRQSAHDAEIKKRGNSLRPKAKSLRSTNESTIEQQAREIDPNPSISFTRTTTRSRSRVLKSPPPPPADTTVDDPPSLPNVNVKQIKDEINAPQIVPRPPRISSRPNTSSDNLRKSSSNTDQTLTANIISNVKRKLSLSKERKPKELEGRISLPAKFTSSGTKKKVVTPSASRSNISNDASTHARPEKPTKSHLSDSDVFAAAANDSMADQHIPPVPPVPKHHSHLNTASERKPSKHDSSSRASSASISGDEFGSSKKTIRHKISRGSSLADTEDNDLNRWSGGSDDLMESIMKETSLFVPSPQGMTPKKETIPISSSQDESKKSTSGHRRRGRTLPGSLATPPPVPSVPLPPMKLGPINVTIPEGTMRKATQKSPLSYTAITPTRLPIPKTKYSYSASSTPAVTSGTSSEDETASSEGKAKKKKNSRATTEQRVSSGHQPKLTSTLTPPTSPKIRPKFVATDIHEPLPTRNASLHPKLPSSAQQKAHASVDSQTQTRKSSVSTTATGSLARAASFYTPSRKAFDTPLEPENPENARKRTLSLHDKLQSMVVKHAIDEDYQAGGLIASTKTEHTTQIATSAKKASETAGATTKSTTTTTRSPKGPQTILKFYAQYLTPYEHSEVQEYEHIYFMGPHAKKVPAVPDKPALNYGYDDERGDYHIVIHDHLAYRYEILQLLGQGSFGQVLKCIDHKTGQTVAVKLIRNKRRFHAQAMTEVNILQKLVEWDPEDKYHNIRMTHYFYFRGHLCVAFECLSMNLYEFIKSNHFQGFSLNLIRRFTIQILRSLCILYEHKVIHCDLKPENILLKHPTKSTIKVIDFGSSCLEHERVYTYIQSRFYRAPEVILGISYGMAIDMWSLGCILAELYTGVPIFPGESEQEQLACIMEILGTPDRYLIEQSTRKKLFFDSSGKPRILANSKGRKRYPGTKTLSHALRCHDAWFIDFIERCLQWDPERRMRPHEALRHEWITQVNSTSSSSSTTTSSSHRRKFKLVSPNNMRSSTGFENSSKHAAVLVDEYYYSAGASNDNTSKSTH